MGSTASMSINYSAQWLMFWSVSSLCIEHHIYASPCLRRQSVRTLDPHAGTDQGCSGVDAEAAHAGTTPRGDDWRMPSERSYHRTNSSATNVAQRVQVVCLV